jgi:hypothetical protein
MPMKIYEFGFFLRFVVPTLFLILPLSALLVLNGGAQRILMLLGGIMASIAFTFVLGKEIEFAEDGEGLSIKYRLLNICIWKKSVKVSDFQNISIYREHVYTRDVPVPAYGGAYVCSLSGSKEVILKTSRSEDSVRLVAENVARLTGLAVKNIGATQV